MISNIKNGRNDVGVLYLSIGEVYKDYTLNSIKFLREVGYKGRVRIITDFLDWQDKYLEYELILVPKLDYPYSSRFYKTQLIKYSFEYNLFLDSDTLAIKSIESIWEFLDNTDIAFCLDLHPNVKHVIKNSINEPERRIFEYTYMKELRLEEHLYFNSGVMLFIRNAATEKLFADWHLEWLRFKHEDQLALVRALSLNNLSILTLPEVWNYRPKGIKNKEEAIEKGIKILHFLSRQRVLMKDFL